MARCVTLAIGLVFAAASAAAQSKVIRAADGDVVIVEHSAQVKIVNRRQAAVRAIHSPAERWVVLLVDDVVAPGGSGDGRVDWTFSFRSVTGEWPLGERWEGPATLDQYMVAGDGGPRGFGLTTSLGLVQIVSPPAKALFADGSAVSTLLYSGAGSGMSRQSFAEAESRAIDNVRRSATGAPQIGIGPGGAPVTSNMSFGVVSAPVERPAGSPQPVRVGGTVRPPVKIKDAYPEYPEDAARAGVTGMVILEIIIGPDGTVTDAKILRSIPLLDAAAIAAVKRWVYEPTHLNGVAVPVILTATVNFPR